MIVKQFVAEGLGNSAHLVAPPKAGVAAARREALQPAGQAPEG